MNEDIRLLITSADNFTKPSGKNPKTLPTARRCKDSKGE